MPLVSNRLGSGRNKTAGAGGLKDPATLTQMQIQSYFKRSAAQYKCGP